MSPILGLVVLFTMLGLGIPVGVAMLAVGTIGFALITDIGPAAYMTARTAYSTVTSYSLSVIPLFLLMGNLINRAEVSRDLYDSAHSFVGHWRGGLSMATILACGGFASVSGSSMATTASMARVAYPAMKRYGYGDVLATGSIAAGGTLGILIPPSVVLILYGVLTETDIGMLFAAGFLPGLLGVVLYMVTCGIIARARPDWAPTADRQSWPERLRSLKRVWAVLLLFGIVMGGIYGGIFTPTEAAGVGAVGAFIIALIRRRLTLIVLRDVLIDTAITTAMMLFVIVGALVFMNYVNVAGLPRMIAGFLAGIDASPMVIVLIICGIYLVLGCILESMSMILLTIPIFFPVITSLGLDPVWFGIIIVMVVEVGLITPPIGLNAFMLRTVLNTVPLGTIFTGIALFLGADILRILLVVVFPEIALFLPSRM
ncbi:TRAP transporter large permease [Fodinicurvata sp. EGI_FJ10296]|uniref:TRAP transporter large permease n=1 Tax=Fodinicurvata sp. EGI_FJ10296 TaxID=3231908 RepID=UPI00345234E2